MPKSVIQILSIAPLLAYLGFLIVFAQARPLYTWDTVPYTAVTLAASTDDAATLHAKTYGYLQANLAPEQYAPLVAGAYAHDLSINPAHFASQLPMYEIKPAYVMALRGLGALGIEPLAALGMMSLVPGVLLCLLLFIWLARHTHAFQASLLVVLFALAARITDLSRVPVPDTFSALVLLAAAYALLVKRWLVPAMGLLILSVAVRTNNILFAGLLLSWLGWSAYAQSRTSSDPARHRRELALIAASFAASCALYFALNAAFDYQWWRLFYHTFIESQTDIAAFTQPFSFAAYWAVVVAAAGQLVAGGAALATAMPLFGLLLAVTLVGGWRHQYTAFLAPRNAISLNQLALLTLPLFGAYFVLFPLAGSWDRFFLPFYAFITLAATARFGARKATQIDANSL